MRCPCKAILAVLLAVPLACQPATPTSAPAPIGKIVERPWEPMRSVEYRMATAKLGQTANSGLLLPMVSPDGQWIACLQTPPGSIATPEDLLRGELCESNRLLLRQTAADAPPRVVCDKGAMWPAWSPAGGTLVFTARGTDGRGELGIHDVASGTTQRRALGPGRLAMPSVAPTGDRIALVDADNLPVSSRIYILNLQDRSMVPGPPLAKGSRQLWPQWIDGQTLVFLDWNAQGSNLCRWTVGQSDTKPIAPVGEIPSSTEALQLFISVSQPASPDGGSIAYYDRLADRLTVVDLAKGTPRGIGQQTRAGCWMGSELIAAADKDLFIFSMTDQAEGNRLLRGPWLPIWASAKDGAILLCTRGASDDLFDLVRVQLVWRH